MPRAALFSLIAACALTTLLSRPARGDCSAPGTPCVDAEPWWLSPSATRLLGISDASATPGGQLELGLTTTLRLRPASLTVPSPNIDGREVNLVSFSVDASLSGRWGLGRGFELTWLVPAGLVQAGAGIKGVTYQSAPGIPVVSLHDPRVGYGYSLPLGLRSFAAKIRFEAKLPLGSSSTLSGERSFVASPSLALSGQRGGFFGGAELGVRLRRPTEFYGLRLGSQALLAAGAAYRLESVPLSFGLELYCLPSLIRSGDYRYLPGEWLASARLGRPDAGFSLGAAGGSGLPISGDAAGSSFALGVAAARVLLFARFVTSPGL